MSDSGVSGSGEGGAIDQGPATPVREEERISSLDTIRGFALGGVLLMNMQAFAMVFAAYMNPTADGGYVGVGKVLWTINHVLADQRFISIFSMLFGAGVLLFAQRLEARTGRSAGVHYRRMFWMLAFGLMHAYLLWFGDILTVYAICGLLVWLCRNWRPRTLAIVGALLLTATAALSLGMEHMPPEDAAKMKPMFAPSAERIAEIEAAYRSGWLEQMPQRAEEAGSFHTWIPMFMWRPFGLMLLGMALLKIGFLAAKRSAGLYLTIGAVGVLGGAALSYAGIVAREARDWDMLFSMGVGGLYNVVGSTLGAFGWLGVILWLCASGALPGLRARLAAVGRMAFTNYLMQTVICTTIFYGHGFGLYGTVDRLTQLGIVAAVFAFQLIASPWWLERYRMGPLEWVWRALTYMRLPPLRR